MSLACVETNLNLPRLYHALFNYVCHYKPFPVIVNTNTDIFPIEMNICAVYSVVPPGNRCLSVITTSLVRMQGADRSVTKILLLSVLSKNASRDKI